MKTVPTNIMFRINGIEFDFGCPWITYRATALSIMKRENITSCKGSDNEDYTIEDFENSIINYHKK